MDYKNVEDKTKKIIENLQKLNTNINLLKTKISQLSKVNTTLEKNKILKIENNNNIIFQSVILKNEFNYYRNIYNIILEKYSRDLYELTEYIIVVLISLNKLEIQNKHEKKIIFNKIIYTGPIDTISSGKLKEIIHNIINNLKVVDDYIKLFNTYIKTLSETNSVKNIHNNTFELNVKYKKEAIIVEYNKYCDKFMKTIFYFKECSDSVISQIETSQLLNFFLKLKDTLI